MGYIYRVQGKYEQVTAKLRQVIDIPPDEEKILNFGSDLRPFAYINLGDIYRQQGKVEEALAKFQQEMQVEIALSIAPTWVNECQGMIYLTQGKLNDAGTEFRQVIELDPNNTMVHYNLACVYSLKNELKLAVESLQKAIKLDKSYIELSKKDPDLDNIRQTPEFQKLIDSY